MAFVLLVAAPEICIFWTHIHAGSEIIGRNGAEVWDLPAYSPDLNPIEKLWSKVKAFLRKTKARTPNALCQAIGDAMEQVAEKTFRIGLLRATTDEFRTL